MAVRSCVTLIDQSVSQLRLHTAGAQQKTRRRNRSATRRLRRNGWATSSWQKGNISLLSSIRFSFFLSTGKRLHCLHTHKERERERELGNSIKGHWRKAERRFASLLFLSLSLACKKQRACHQTNIESHPLNVNKSIDDLGLAAALVPAQL